ncbi:hypothetical protein D3C86_1829780 [compost metagenome]
MHEGPGDLGLAQQALDRHPAGLGGQGRIDQDLLEGHLVAAHRIHRPVKQAVARPLDQTALAIPRGLGIGLPPLSKGEQALAEGRHGREPLRGIEAQRLLDEFVQALRDTGP